MMQRRDFLKSIGAGIVSSTLPSTRSLVLPATLDLRIPLRLAISCIVNRMDPDENYRPWFAVDVKNGVPTKLRHDVWDFGDMSGRFLEALILARNMIEPTATMLQAEVRIRNFLGSLMSSNGLVMNPDLGRHDHMFSQGSALFGLVTDFDDSRDPALKLRIQTLIQALNDHAVHTSDYLWFPEVATSIAPCSHMAAYQVLPVVRFFELTGDPAALHYAEKLSRWAFYDDKTVTVDGVITKSGWEGHLHAWMDTYTGVIRCARAGGHLDLQEVLRRSHKLFEWIRLNETHPFGWVADSVGSTTCETCTISSAIRLALELIREGHPEYWNDIERFVRNQLIQNQFKALSHLHIQDADVARGLHGAFESYAAPNTLIATENETIEGCCINGGIRCLFLAYQNAIHETDDTITINLLMSHSTAGVRVVSFFPHQGRLELYPKCSKSIWVRCPDWLSLKDLKVDGPVGLAYVADPETHSLRFAGATTGTRIVLTLPQREETVSYVVAGRQYDVQWKGDTVMNMTPPGEPYPLYQRSAYFRSRAHFGPSDEVYRQPTVQW
jgi:hypothetical protein